MPIPTKNLLTQEYSLKQRTLKFKQELNISIMLRKYGTPPYHLVLLHGGPGAIGSLNPLAEELAARYDLGA